ncbi:helix-turn-helix domain-containing protein [Thalassobacillus sp. CUG 92003]|uniref:helix-turn-helix domain-containing protein n=1 Tax=Thalassobacillus sp. CUG 92003 TaxID=2736641 RepID=UPI001C62C3E1|nr:helix-turn-helix domain-containing protein [Thalassobacillus sp. CUG 92003]
MPREEGLTVTFKALTHPIRRSILDLLKDGPKTTGYLSDQFQDVSRYAVMKHLAYLEEADLVSARRKGRIRENHLNALPLHHMYDRWMTQYQSDLARSISTIQSHYERGTISMANEGFKHDSFQIEQEVKVKAPISQVFTALTEEIDAWWSFRVCGEGSELLFEPKLGGQFIERKSNNYGALWGTVTFIHAPFEIRMDGILGMNGAVTSSYTFTLNEKGDETVVSLSHHAAGLLDPDWHRSYTEGWEDLLQKYFKSYVEEGKTYKDWEA